MEQPSNPTPATPTASTEETEEQQRGREVEQITKRILGCGFKVHTALGPGLFERTYHVCMVHELKKSALWVESGLVLPAIDDGLKIDAAYRVDLRVERKVLVEIKAIEKIASVHHAQMPTYL
jgi:GxxExxY protein